MSHEFNRPAATEACPSDLVIDRWVAGDGASSTRDHLDACERCRARVSAFEAARDGAAPVVARVVARAGEAAASGGVAWPRWPRWLLGAASAAGAVALMVAVLSPPVGDEVRAKGSSMRFVVQRDGQVVAGRSGEVFRAGDALRFLVSTGARAQFILVGIEEGGRVSAYHPFDGDRSVALAPGVDTPLPGSLVLDNARATEYFLGIFAEAPVSLSEIEAAVAEARGGGELSLPVLSQVSLPGSHHWVVVRKE